MWLRWWTRLAACPLGIPITRGRMNAQEGEVRVTWLPRIREPLRFRDLGGSHFGGHEVAVLDSIGTLSGIRLLGRC